MFTYCVAAADSLSPVARTRAASTVAVDRIVVYAPATAVAVA